jgi:hypothetical protein
VQCVGIVTELTSASRRQNHTTSSSAKPNRSSFGGLASIASRTHVRDDRETPLFGRRETGGEVPVICPSPQARRLRRIGATGKSARDDRTECQVRTAIPGRDEVAIYGAQLRT